MKPGGHLVLTVHGAHSLAMFAREGLRDDELLARAAVGLNAEGHFFHDEFGDAGDEGLVAPPSGASPSSGWNGSR